MSLKRAICDKLDDPVALDVIRQLKTSRALGRYNTKTSWKAKDVVQNSIPQPTQY